MNLLELLKVPAINGGVIAATTWIDGMTDVLQVMLLLATLIWTVVKIAQAVRDLEVDWGDKFTDIFIQRILYHGPLATRRLSRLTIILAWLSIFVLTT